MFSPVRRGVRFVTDHLCDAGSTNQRPSLHIASRADYYIEIGVVRTNGDSSCIWGGIDSHNESFDYVELWKAIYVSILLCVSFVLISVTKLCDMIIHLCICKGRTHHSNVGNSKSLLNMTNEPVIVFPVTVLCQSKNLICDEIYQQVFSKWCHTSHRRSGQCAIWTCTHDNGHAAFIHAFECTMLRLALVPIVQILKIAYGRSWKSRQKSRIRNCGKVRGYWSKICGWVCMLRIAGLILCNVIWLRHLSFISRMK